MRDPLPSPFPDEYPGYIVLPDFLEFPQILEFGNVAFAMKGRPLPLKCQTTIDAVNNIVEWHIDNLPAKPTPADIYRQPDHPALVAGAFYDWVLGAVSGVWLNEKSIPKGSGPTPTDTPKTQQETTPQ